MKQQQLVALLVAGLVGFAAAAASTTSGSGNGNSGNGNGNGGSKGDPIFSGFDGSTYNFDGEAYSYYNVLTEAQHSINAYFTPAVMHDHNGTYISAFGITYDIHRLAVHVQEDGSLAVELNGQALTLANTETAMTVRLTNKKNPSAGKMTVTWEMYRPSTGHTVEVQTPLVTFTVYSVAPGTLDEGGVIQPAYLDSKVSLLKAPVNNALAGVLGDSYIRLVEHLRDGKALPTERFTVPTADRKDLKATSLFDISFPSSLFAKPGSLSRRQLGEAIAMASEQQVPVAFPVHGASAGILA